MKTKFDLEEVYKKFLPKMGIRGPVSDVQSKVMKDIFYGAIGELLTIQKEQLSELEEDEAVEQLQSMFDQVGNHFLKVTNQHN